MKIIYIVDLKVRVTLTMFLRSFNTLIRRSSAPVPSIQSRSFRIIIGVDEEEEGARKYSQRRADEKQIVKDVWNELLEDADSDACDPYLGERMVSELFSY